jgi:AcrR family transcriptional regulator
VFEAAVGEFASKGYGNASMNSLVKGAGISKGSIFQLRKQANEFIIELLREAVERGEIRDDGCGTSCFSVECAAGDASQVLLH